MRKLCHIFAELHGIHFLSSENNSPVNWDLGQLARKESRNCPAR